MLLLNISGDVMVQKVEDVENDFHFTKRKHAGTWINTGVYKQIWKALGKKATFASHDRTEDSIQHPYGKR